jgi:hypothetical protein
MILIAFLIMFFLGTPALVYFFGWYSWNREYVEPEAMHGAVLLYWISLFLGFAYIAGQNRL